MLNRSITPVPGSSPYLVRCIGRGTPRSNVYPAGSYEQAVGVAKARGLDAMILRRSNGTEVLVGAWSQQDGVVR